MFFCICSRYSETFTSTPFHSAGMLRALSSHYRKEEQDGLQARQARIIDAGLVSLGIRRLNELLENDVDKRKKKKDVSFYLAVVSSLVLDASNIFNVYTQSI